MICPNCGHENQPTNLFCAHCANSLNRQQVHKQALRRIMLPPQDRAEASRPATSRPSPWPLIIVAATLLLLLWALYG